MTNNLIYRASVIFLLIVMAALAVQAAKTTGQTVDEAFFSASGYAMVRHNNYEFLGEHPPLASQIGAIPLAFLKLNFPISDPWLVPNTDRIDVARNGRRFLYQMGNDPEKILFLQRLPIVVLTILLGLGIFCFAGELFGLWGALLSLGLFAFDPNILAHGSLYTTDMTLTAFYFFTIYALKRFFDAPSDLRAILLGFSCGAGFMSKISGLILLPVLLCLFAIYSVSVPKKTITYEPSRGFVTALLVISIFLLANALGEKQAMVLFGPCCLCALYFYGRDLTLVQNSKLLRTIVRCIVLSGAVLCLIYSMRLKKKYGASLSTLLIMGNLLALGAATLFSRLPSCDARMRILKYFLSACVFATLFIVLDYTDITYKFHRFIGFGNYMKPLGIVFSHSAGGHGSCVEGSFISCDWKYFPGIMAVKTPLLTLVLIVLGTFGWIFSKRSALVKSLLLLPPAFFLCAAMLNKIHIGLRHILPIYPFLFMLGGYVGSLIAQISSNVVKQFLGATLAVLFILTIGRTILTGPDYLSYFNEGVGSVEKGAKLVADSNLNWGQGNKRLAEFVLEKRIPQISIMTEAMNEDVYNYYGIPWKMANEEDLKNPPPGYYALGISCYTRQQSDPTSWFKGKRPLFRVGKTFLIFHVQPERIIFAATKRIP